MDPKETVRTGYDALSFLYRRDDHVAPHHEAWATQLLEILSESPARVLDLGCGCGIPVARDLALAGHTVLGVDISAVQIDRAKKLVPGGTFVQGDIAALAKGEPISESPETNALFSTNGQFDAVVALYVLIHLPVSEQTMLIRQIGEWLKEGGFCMVIVGISAQTFELGGWLGSDESVKMWWEQAGIEEYRKWAVEAGFEIVEDKRVKDLRAPEDFEGHQFLLLKKLPMSVDRA
ncbi:S-adenosyl-L-methionine-dependent methyltransferase [Leucogyrophana mollusca]|uniref:S-adenosyl-L-methionine-dependent methyltransferase n=1 Tax=Leucogyrophana mollusca TaxID=85980 RepID=A0ACB8BRT1_9AGAM|nr:S-adenosyl-L-methionine-dependent methyltransferase [Leucogyrophana mollusca]